MKTKPALKIFFGIVLAIVMVGCATHRVDWKTRVGNYTFDQAVVELGPPDKQQKLTDGKTVAEWISRYNGGSSVAIGSGFYGHPGGVGFIQSVGPNTYESKLRLTFSTNNILEKWSKD